MFDADTIAQLNGEYKMPANAGPAWKEAARMGFDMTLIEEHLAMTPSERLARNDSFVALARMLQAGRIVDDHGRTHEPS